MVKQQRKFVIKVTVTDSDVFHWTHWTKTDLFIEEIKKLSAGYSYVLTSNKHLVKIWKYKKSCEKSIERLNNKLEPTKSKNKKFEITEITDNKTLRNIKLKKINRK